MERRVIVIGAGLAGMVAARSACENGAEVVLLDRGPIGIGSNSALSNGVFSGPTPLYSEEQYVTDTVETGRKINRLSYVRQTAGEASNAFQFLRSAGINLIDSPRVYSVKSASPDVIPGVTLVRRLAESLNEDGIQILSGFYVKDLLIVDNCAWGVRVMDRTGAERDIPASAVILACGGAGALFRFNDNQKNTMGQGYHLAARAGLSLWDMEFVQFYPIVLAEAGLPSLIIYPPYPQEAKLVNEAGEDISEKRGLGSINNAVRKKRDVFAAVLMEEGKGGAIYLDLRRVPESLWGEHPLCLLRKIRFDFRAKPVRVGPAAHFMCGGVRTDKSGQTEVAGLFACGEIVWGLHGANRMGGNALTECVVSGRIAGWSAAGFAASVSPAGIRASDFLSTPDPKTAPDAEDLKTLRRIIRATSWAYAGIARREEGLREGMAQTEAIEERLKRAATAKPSDAILRFDLISAAFTLKAILAASLGRRESRGSFIRSDFPKEDESKVLVNSCLTWGKEENRFVVRHVPVERD